MQMGSVKYSSGTLLGNWREDVAIEETRLADFMLKKDTRQLSHTQHQEHFGSQRERVPLSDAPADGKLRMGEPLMLRSRSNKCHLAVSLGQQLSGSQERARFPVFCRPDTGSEPVARCVLRITR